MNSGINVYHIQYYSASHNQREDWNAQFQDNVAGASEYKQ